MIRNILARTLFVSSALTTALVVQAVASGELEQKVQERHQELREKGITGSGQPVPGAPQVTAAVNIGGKAYTIDSKKTYEIQERSEGTFKKPILSVSGADIISKAQENDDYYANYNFIGEKK